MRAKSIPCPPYTTQQSGIGFAYKSAFIFTNLRPISGFRPCNARKATLAEGALLFSNAHVFKREMTKR
jgi:hypothetical protein